MMLIKERAQQLWTERLAQASTDPSGFRKGIITTLVEEYGCSIATASTQYNAVKNRNPPVPGLGRQRAATPAQQRSNEDEDEDEPCYSVLELEPSGRHYRVARSRAFLLQGDASETYDIACQSYPNSVWVLIYGIGPLHGERYRLSSGEREIKRSK